ncbi:MAG: hypothetical protein ACKVJU_24420 [Verrucomicrobiales bacterium]
MKLATTISGTAIAIVIASIMLADDKPESGNAVNGVKGVKQDAVQSVKNEEPPTVAPTAAEVNTVKGVKAPGKEATPNPPTEDVKGIEAVTTNKVQAVPPPPAGAVSTIQAVKGVQGIVAPKQLNLEAALLVKEEGTGTPPPGNPTAGAAAALLSAPPGLTPGPAPNGDGRADFQEFEKLTTPGS